MPIIQKSLETQVSWVIGVTNEWSGQTEVKVNLNKPQ